MCTILYVCYTTFKKKKKKSSQVNSAPLPGVRTTELEVQDEEFRLHKREMLGAFEYWLE